MAHIKPIETEYKSVKFRSKLEAMYAKWFDDHEIKWIYEPYIIEYSEGSYLPDFYLLELKLYFEVKGEGVSGEEKAIQAISELPNKEYTHYHPFELIVGRGFNLIGYFDDDQPVLSKCSDCNKYYFRCESGSWECSYCGRSGDDFIDSEIELKSIRQDWKHKPKHK